MDLSSKTLAELREIAKENGIRGVTALRKPQLLQVLENEIGENKNKYNNTNYRETEPEEKKYNAPAAPAPRMQRNARNSHGESGQNRSADRGNMYGEQQQGREMKRWPRRAVRNTDNNYSPQRRNYGEQSQSRNYNEQNQTRNYGEQSQSRNYSEQNQTRNYGEQSQSRNYNEQNQTRNYGEQSQSRNYNEQNQTRNYGEQSQSRNYSEQNQTRSYGEREEQNTRPADENVHTGERFSTPQNETQQGTMNSGTHSGTTQNQYNETQHVVRQNYNYSYNSQQKIQYHDGSDGLISIVKDRQVAEMRPVELKEFDSGVTRKGVLEVMPEGYGFLRCDSYLPGENDVYVPPQFIRRFGVRTGDVIEGNLRINVTKEKFSALLYMKEVNGKSPAYLYEREKFENLTPVFPDERIHLETPGAGISMRMLDLISPIGKGQRGMIVSQPKTGKTTLLKQVARAVTRNYPKMKLMILLIDERPEEVTDIKESIEGENVSVIYSTFDELPENHKRVSEMTIERAKRMVEDGQDVMILLDSITRLARAYNLTVTPSGRTLSGGLDPAALHMPKRFFGAARNMREGGSLTILATALVDTGSRMDDVVFEEFKGTGNMEIVLDRTLSEKRIFPAIDIQKSSTRREDLLLDVSEQEVVTKIRKALGGMKSDHAMEQILNLFRRTKDNKEFVETVKKMHL